MQRKNIFSSSGRAAIGLLENSLSDAFTRILTATLASPSSKFLHDVVRPLSFDRPFLILLHNFSFQIILSVLYVSALIRAPSYPTRFAFMVWPWGSLLSSMRKFSSVFLLPLQTSVLVPSIFLRILRILYPPQLT